MGFGDRARRGRLGGTVSKSKRRRLKLDIQVDESVVFDAYEEPSADGWQWLNAADEWTPRPLPSSQVLASASALATQSKNSDISPIPLLQDFYQKIRRNDITKAAADEQKEQDDDSPDSVLESIDDPSKSNLTIGHHQRYLKYTSSSQEDRWTHAQKREFYALKKQVLAEQDAYQRELYQSFFGNHVDTFRVGFTSQNNRATTFARSAIQLQRWQRLSMENLKETAPKHFGKCRQVISLQSLDVSHAINALCNRSSEDDKKPKMKLVAQDLEFEVVHRAIAGVPRVEGLNVTNCTGEVPSPSAARIPQISLLQDDKTAYELAQKHKASAIITSETLESIMQLPGIDGSKWMTYISLISNQNTSQRIALLDIPVAQQYTSPRQCLTEGFQEGISQWLTVKCDQDEGKKRIGSAAAGYIYSLWKLPKLYHSPGSISTNRILVRSTVRFVDNLTGFPVRLRAHIQYFPHRGREVSSSYERALWIIDQAAMNRDVLTRTARVDPHTSRILDWEETSVAHAITSGDSSSVNVDPMVHWQVAMQILSSLHTIPKDTKDCLLCFPGRGEGVSMPGMSVSIHFPAEKEEKKEQTIDFESNLKQAGGVLLGAAALQRCAREWKWPHADRIPHTFPPKTN